MKIETFGNIWLSIGIVGAAISVVVLFAAQVYPINLDDSFLGAVIVQGLFFGVSGLGISGVIEISKLVRLASTEERKK